MNTEEDLSAALHCPFMSSTETTPQAHKLHDVTKNPTN